MEIQYKIFKSFYEKAARKMAQELKPFIENQESLLDLGCGSGIVVKQIKQELNIKNIKGLDVIDLRVEDIPFQKYNGTDLSFIKDNSYNVVLISYVLHHTKDPIDILNQILRISNKYIIIYEDLYEGFLGKKCCNIHGKFFNDYIQKNHVNSHFFSEKEWEEHFKKLNLEIVFRKEKSFALDPVRRMLFVLKKGV